MKLTKNAIDDLNIEVSLSIEPSDYAEGKKKKLVDIRRRAEIKGFRKGMVPMSLIEKMYGNSALVDAVNDVISEQLNSFIKDEKLSVIGEPLPAEEQPKNEWTDGNRFEFKFDIACNPAVSLELDKKDEVVYYDITVTEEAKKEMKVRQKEFAKKLASYADVYVNDAFGTAHRKHASTAVIADYFDADSKMLGYLMEKEVTAIDNVLKNAQHPFTAIIGGSKVSSKLGVIKNLLDKVDNLIIGGGMGYTFIKAQGGHIGESLHEDDLMPEALNVMAAAKEKGVNLSLSVATVAADRFANDANRKVVDIFNIPDGWEGMDASEESLEHWKKIILESKTILWNGPVGVFEMENFAHGTGEIAKYVAQATQENGAFSLVGGGDSVAAVNKFGLADKVSYVSTGGGAMLEAIEGKVLPGVAAIEG